MIFSRTIFVALGLAFLASGCGKRYEFADPAEGTLTLDGKPVPRAFLEFIPQPEGEAKMPRSSAVTDDQGFFRLMRSDNQQSGAVVGTHRVVIHPNRPPSSRKRSKGGDDEDGEKGDGKGNAGALPSAAMRVPSVYMSAAQTPLQVEVTKDQKIYDLKMTLAGH
jgi:hypothetical protein